MFLRLGAIGRTANFLYERWEISNFQFIFHLAILISTMKRNYHIFKLLQHFYARTMFLFFSSSI